MAKKVKLGIIGMSDGNGHPYSWSAIFNGYNPDLMDKCPFPAIPAYLKQQNFPEDSLGNMAVVSHIWSQDMLTSQKIAEAANIPEIVSHPEDMLPYVDGILLARDDAENHYEMALPFLKAGLPIFIDKPLALSKSEAHKILEAQKYENQVFSCSSIRFAEELIITEEDKVKTGKIVHVEASVPKNWDTYVVHVLEPLLSQMPQRGKLINTIPFRKNGIHHILVEWENLSAYIKVTGIIPSPIKLEFFGQEGNINKVFKDSFSCFKSSLEYFVDLMFNRRPNISRVETLEIVEIIERGRI